MKQLVIILGASLMMGTNVYAAPPANDVIVPPKLTSKAPVKHSNTDEDARKLMAVVTGCALDDKCIIDMLTMLVKTDPVPVYNSYLKLAGERKVEIDNNIKNCNTQQTRAYKKVVAGCMSDHMNKLLMDEKALKECMVIKIEELGKANNLYALAFLANYSLENNDVKSHTYWMNTLRSQGKSPESGIFEQCAQGLSISMKITMDVLTSMLKEEGIAVPSRPK